MNYKYLLQTENDTTKTTHKKHFGWFNFSNECIDWLFQVAYYVGEEKDVESNEGNFLTFAHSHLLKIPYTTKAISILVEKGYYLESAVLIRNFLEIIVQLRFFQRNKEKLNDYILKKIKITLKTMFDEFNTNLYTKMYYALCEAAHGGFGSSIYRTTYKSPKDGITIMGSKYNEMFANYILNQLIPLCYGCVNFIPMFFKHYKDLVPNNIESNRESVLLRAAGRKLAIILSRVGCFAIPA